MKNILVLLTLCFVSNFLLAQQKIIRGTISSDSSVLQNVSVYEKDVPTNGTVTNEKGQFQLNIRGKGVLVVKYIGFVTQEIAVGSKTQLTLSLVSEKRDLEDVVVIGYGSKKKINNTAAVSAITGDELRQTPSASFQNSLIGRVTGIVSQQRSGQPGSDGANILVRGTVSLGGTPVNPIIMVDDIRYNGPLSDIDPDQIESLTVLKDAATTAIYGIDGANGAILITTRRGKTGKPQVSFRSETSAQAPTFMPKFLGSYQSALLRNEALRNDSILTPAWTDTDLQLFKDGTDPYGHPDIDWQKVLLRPYSMQTSNTFNITGGADKTKYFVSAGYLWQNGMVKDFATKDLNSNYYFKRYNFRSNLDVQATKSLLINFDFAGNIAERNEPNILGRNNRNKVLFEINDYVQLPPFAYALYNPDGSYGSNPSMFGTYSNNVIGRFALGGYNRSFDNDLIANLKVTQKLDFITRGLSIRGVLAYNAHFKFWRSMTRANFPSFGYNQTTGVYTPFNSNVYDVEKLSLGYYADAPNSYKNLNYQASVNYERTFSGHHVTGLVLYNRASAITGAVAPVLTEGYVFRAAYDFKQRYLLEVSAGYNGTSRFSTTQRYALFPAISGGWNLSQEPFFRKAFKFIDLFKFRASHGLVGSGEIDLNGGQQYAYIQNYVRSGSYSIGDVSRTVSGIIEGTLGTEVTWQKERQTDFGIDIKMFKNKLSITADYFKRYRYDILITRGSVSNILGVGVPPVNIGIVENNGYEFEVGYNGNINKLNYSVRGNISTFKNKVVFRDEAQPTYPWLSLTGKSVGSPIGYTYTGFYQSYDDIAKSPVTPIKARPGDLKYEDLNNDGKIDVNDQRVLDYPNLPNTVLGFTGSLEYKGISLSFTLQSALNFAMKRDLTGNYTEQRLDSWRPDNLNPTYPRLSTVASVSGYDSDFWFRRMDYLRVKTIQLGYQLPKTLVNKIHLNGIRVYASGYNLFTWMLKGKNIYDFDPEAPTSTEGGDYPVQKIVNLGLQVTF